MKRMRASVLFLAPLCQLLLMAACGSSHDPEGDAGVPAPPVDLDEQELDLSDDDYLALCQWWSSQWGWPTETRWYCLDGGASFTLQSPDDCLATRFERADYPDCDVRVRDWYDCMAAMPDWCGPKPMECRRPPGCGADWFWL